MANTIKRFAALTAKIDLSIVCEPQGCINVRLLRESVRESVVESDKVLRFFVLLENKVARVRRKVVAIPVQVRRDS